MLKSLLAARITTMNNPKDEVELLHVAVCQAVQLLTQGNNWDASSVLRDALVGYADIVEARAAPPSVSEQAQRAAWMLLPYFTNNVDAANSIGIHCATIDVIATIIESEFAGTPTPVEDERLKEINARRLAGYRGATVLDDIDYLLTRLSQAEAERSAAMKVLDPSMPESGLEDACRQLKQAYVSADGNVDTLEQRVAELTAQVESRNELIVHMHVHSGYPSNGYMEMTTRQKALYDEIWAKSVAKLDALEAAAAEGSK